MAPRLDRLDIGNLRSIGSPPTSLTLPAEGPLVLLGENNAGKSNITRAIEILFGERWPKNIDVEAHDFFDRDPDQVAIKIGAAVSGISCPGCGADIKYLRWHYDKQALGDPIDYSLTCTNAHCNRTYMTGDARNQLFAMSVGADRRLSYQLSYTSKYTLLSRLMHRFHNSLTSDEQRRQELARIFESLLEQFAGVPEFSEFRALLGSTAAELGQNQTYRLDIDFSAYDPSNFFRSLRVNPNLAGEVRSFDELGTGQEQVLALAFSYAYAKAFGKQDGLLLVIDEPESHLHPLAQRWLASRLNSMSTDGLQVIITTHSPHFVDLSKPENLVIVQKEPNPVGTRARQCDRPSLVSQLTDLGADPNAVTTANVGEYYEASANDEIRAAMFSKLCILVEGPTEALALPHLLGLMDLDPLRHGIACVSVGGITNIARWVRLFRILQVPVYPLFDTDSDKAGNDAIERLRSRQEIMAALGLPGDHATIDQLSSDPVGVRRDFGTMNPNFELATGSLFGQQWLSHYQMATAIVGTSKPLRARYAAMRLVPGTISADAVTQLTALVARLRELSSHEYETGDLTAATIVDSTPDWDEPPF